MPALTKLCQKRKEFWTWKRETKNVQIMSLDTKGGGKMGGGGNETLEH